MWQMCAKASPGAAVLRPARLLGYVLPIWSTGGATGESACGKSAPKLHRAQQCCAPTKAIQMQLRDSPFAGSRFDAAPEGATRGAGLHFLREGRKLARNPS